MIILRQKNYGLMLNSLAAANTAKSLGIHKPFKWLGKKMWNGLKNYFDKKAMQGSNKIIGG